MRLRARQTRFLCGTIGGWIVVRAIMLLAWPGSAPRIGTPRRPGPMGPVLTPVLAPVPAPAVAVPGLADAPPPSRLQPVRLSGPRRPVAMHPPEMHPPEGSALRQGRALPEAAATPDPVPVETAATTSAPDRARPTARSRWAAESFLFVRPGSGDASLAAGGMLGGSQLAARLTYRLDRDGPTRTALAARVYAPLAGGGREAALGLDWHPAPAVPLRLSVERRVALDRQGRNAWSAYAAGGFYRAPLGGLLVVDGYAQAGIVGARAHDLFVDGAVRAGRRLMLGPATAALGAGLWGAAQPGVARLDAGPRLGVTLPAADRSISLAIEARLRVAGAAGPGSGAALTLGVDL